MEQQQQKSANKNNGGGSSGGGVYSEMFKKLTPQSLKEIKERKQNERIRIEIEKTEALIEMMRVQQLSEERHKLSNENPVKLRKQKEKQLKQHQETLKNIELKKEIPIKDFATGSKLPKAYADCFPSDLSGIPLEEIDDYYKSEYVRPHHHVTSAFNK